MQLGMIGLGRMGANLVRRLMRDGHKCVVYDHTPAHVDQLAAEGSGVLLISSELEELMGLCDRILVMSRGEICGEFTRDWMA